MQTQFGRCKTCTFAETLRRRASISGCMGHGYSCKDAVVSVIFSSWQADEPAERNLPMRKQPRLSNWLFRQEVLIPEDVASLIVPTEQPITAYTTSRDSAIFTTKRLILSDVRGLRRKKQEVQSRRIR